MTAADLASVLRNDAGVVASGDGGAQFEASILQTIIRTLVEIYSQAPSAWISEIPRAEVVRAPTNVNIAVTRDSKTITFTDYQSWMLDCTIVIDGEPAQNQITIDGAAPVSLVKPFNGPTGTTTAIVYHDSIKLGSDVFRVGSPVMLDRAWELSPMDTPRDLQIAQPGVFQGIGPYYGTGYDYASQGMLGFTGSQLRTQDKRITRPYAFRVARAFAFNAVQTCRLSLSSLPDTRHTIDYPAQIVPFPTSLADTSRPEYLPFYNDQTILVPWMRWNFASTPNAMVSKSTLKTEFDAATAMLKKLTAQPFVQDCVQIGVW